MTYKIAEKFKSIQGEGVYAGTPMAFIRFVGCSVGKTICQHCDTDFDKPLTWRGGGEFDVAQLIDWIGDYRHVCLTGGEPLDQALGPLVAAHTYERDDSHDYMCPPLVHIETSGTKTVPEFNDSTGSMPPNAWICVSPKPGFKEDVVMQADEVKVIVPGLGEITPRVSLHYAGGEDLKWPTLEDALRWAAAGKIVFLQPRNGKFDIDKQNLLYVMDLLKEYPQFRLSYQAHKLLKVQ